MKPQWTAERVVSADEARRLIAAYFPTLQARVVEPLGDGWDNTAYLVDGEWVFRFPRRQIAVELLGTEARALVSVAPTLPLPVPTPVHVHAGDPQAAYPWPFAGYRLLSGTTACRAAPSDEARRRAAPALGTFLAALHGFPATRARELGVPGDTIRRLELPYRIERVEQAFATAVEAGLIQDTAPLRPLLEDLPAGWTPRDDTLVHGDLYARHLLVDESHLPCGVIDWGDLHLGDAAIDLSIAPAFLPPAAHDAFRDAYIDAGGAEITDDTWRVARFRALHAAVMILVYGNEVGDAALVREGRDTLGRLTA